MAYSVVSKAPGWIILLFGFLNLLTIASASFSSQCYYPNGNESTDTPCYTDGRVTHCCGEESICLTNQLCLSVAQPFSLSRGSCTDKSWGTDCPSTCRSAQEAAGAAVVWLTNGTTTSEEPQYCCNSAVVSANNTIVCSTVDGDFQNPFTISNGSAIANAAALSGLVEESSSSTVANTTASGNYTAMTKSQSSCNNSSKDVAIGAGVGIPLGVIALLLIVWAMWERRLRKQTPVPGQAFLLSDNNSHSHVREMDGSKVPELYDGSTITGSS
ncbi:hypothetical protein N7454_006228 [Penicillium verhagenii]|nr:hypothetical protein N7454_006228 [Penicillium verhagenii]